MAEMRMTGEAKVQRKHSEIRFAIGEAFQCVVADHQPPVTIIIYLRITAWDVDGALGAGVGWEWALHRGCISPPAFENH
jgi:hypothetical protein